MRRSAGTRVLAIIFCVSLLLTPGNVLSVFAMNDGYGEFSDEITVIAEFAALEETIAQQTVPCGTVREDLSLPDTLTVSAYVYNETISDPAADEMILENISWTAEPDYDGDIEGEYVFIPELSSYSVKAAVIPSVTVTVEMPKQLPEEEQLQDDASTPDEKTTVITAFAPLDEKVLKQTVPRGTAEEDLLLPDFLTVTADIYDESAGETVSSQITLENVIWQAEPDYDSESSGEYVFAPVFSSYTIESDLLPLITVIVEDELAAADLFNLEAMAAGLEHNPRPLTMEDLIADFDIPAPYMPKGLMLFDSMPETRYPATIVIGEDNENNAHAGKADNDIDVHMKRSRSNYPIEISFTLDHLPVESAYIAVKAFDVDEESGEKDYVFINDTPAAGGVVGESIGYLSGNDGKWNTTVLKIPLSKLHQGKNYVSFTISSGWLVTIDWIQLILDGGAADDNITNFVIKLDDAVQSGRDVEISASVKIEQKGSSEYYTEYMLTDEAGNNLSSYFGKAKTEENATLFMPLRSPTGTYTVTAILKDKQSEIIKASDAITFDWVKGQLPVFGVKTSYDVTPSQMTNGSVSIQLMAEKQFPDVSNVQIWCEGENITANSSGYQTTANHNVSENGTYNFSVNFTRSGRDCTSNCKVTVANIDSVSPAISVSDVSVLEDTSDKEVLGALDNTIRVTDNVAVAAIPYTLAPDKNLAVTPGEKTVTITAWDKVGNEAEKDILLKVIPKPVQISQGEVSLDKTNSTAAFAAVLKHTGGLDITESGFVWAVSQNPTVEVCNGKKSIAGPVAKGGSIEVAAEDIVKGVNYYVRAYIKSGDDYYYSEQKNFGIGAPQYGSFSVSSSKVKVDAAGGKAIFTINRPDDQTEGNQTVYYRTVNGSAIGSLHFDHKKGTLNFAEGEYEKTVEVDVNGCSKQYENYPTSAYQNEERSFYLEIYKVEGGATIGGNRAKKTIALDNAKKVYANAYNDYTEVDVKNETEGELNHDGFGECWNIEDTDTVSFTSIQKTDETYLDATSEYYALQYKLKVKEKNKGYQLIQVSTRTQNLFQFSHNEFPDLYDDVFYAVVLEHGCGDKVTTYWDYDFPIMSQGDFNTSSGKSRITDYKARQADDGKGINIGKNKTVYVYYDASGDDNDNWFKKDFIPFVRAVDKTEPRLLAVAPLAGGNYSYGDEVYVSLIFDEIVGSADGVSISTNLSDTPFVYEEGTGTNVLVFKGIVDKDNQKIGSVEVISVNNSKNIKDLADDTGTFPGNTQPNTGIDANTNRPDISFDSSSTGTLPRHTTRVSIGSAVSACYTWSQSPAMPVSGWINFPSANGGIISENLAGGDNGAPAVWYLHVLATHDNGNTRWGSREFSFQPASMSVTVNNNNWAQSREIELKVTNPPDVPVNIAVTGAETGNYTRSESINVKTNGIYTFTLTDDYGSGIVKSVDVSRIDRIAPVITLKEYGDTLRKYTSLDFSAVAADEETGSGLSGLQYKWTDSDSRPDGGWIDMAPQGGLIPTYETPGIVYLHIKAVDNAGNTAYACSKGYTVLNNTPPDIEVTGNSSPDTWKLLSVSLDYTVKKTNAAISSINAAGTELEKLPDDYPFNGSVDVDENGLYTFMVTDVNGLCDTDTVLVNYIDKEAPVASFGYGAGNTADSWAQGKSIIIHASDDSSPVVDAKGAVTGYGGSGIDFIEWKKDGDSTYYSIDNGGSFAAENAPYYIKVSDKAGNSKEYTLTISGIDTVEPDVEITVPAAYQQEADLEVSCSDDYSGIASARYAVAENKDMIPASLSDLPLSGEIAVSNQGINYIYYEVTDNAGNTASGWSDPIKVDKIQPELSVSAHKGSVDGALYSSGEWSDDNVVFVLENSVEQLSGTSYRVRTRADDSAAWSEWQDVSDMANAGHIVSASTLLEFKAVSGSGRESMSSAYTVKIDTSRPAEVSLSGASAVWQKDNVTLTVSARDDESGIKEYYVSADGGITYGTAIPWNVEGINQYTIEISGDYTDKIKVKVKNHAGLEAESENYTVKLDKTIPELSVSAHKGSVDGALYSSGEWSDSNVVFILENNAEQLSGTSYQVKLDGGDWEAISGNIYTISANTNTGCQFKAVSGAKLFDASNVITVRIQKSLDKPMETGMLSPAPNDENSWYNTATNITVNKPAADEGQAAIAVKYKLWPKEKEEPAAAIILADTGIPILSDGRWNLKIWTEDDAGNCTEPINENYYVDTAEPIITGVQYQRINSDGTRGELVNFSDKGNFSNRALHVTVSVADALSLPHAITYRLGDSGDYSEDIAVYREPETGAYTAAFVLPLGTNSPLNILAKDAAGNETENPTETGMIMIEEQAPLISFSGAELSEAGSDKWLNGSPLLMVNVNDSAAGQLSSSLDNLIITVKRWDGISYSEAMTDMNQNFSNISEIKAIKVKSHELVLNSSGKYEISVKTADRAGNSAERIAYINVDGDSPDSDPVLKINGTGVDSLAYYQAETYTVKLPAETDIRQSPVKAQYKLNNSSDTGNNVDEWTDVPADNKIVVKEGTNTVELRSIDAANNVSAGVTYTVNRDITPPIIRSFAPVNASIDRSIAPALKFTADEPLLKGEGYITVYEQQSDTKVIDVHSSNNRVKLSDRNKTVTVTLPQPLAKGMEYYIKVDGGFVTDRAGNKLAAFGQKDTWSFKTVSDPVVPDSEIEILGYTVELISRDGVDGVQTSQYLSAVTDREYQKQHNVIAKAGYSENGTDYYIKLKVTPIMSAAPRDIRVSSTAGTVTLSGDEKYIDVLIPKGTDEAKVFITLGNSIANQFTIKIVNSSYRAVVETGDGVSASVDESNLLNSVDLSKEIAEAQQPETSVEVTIKLNIEKQENTEIPELDEFQQTMPDATLLFLDIAMEKLVTTTIDNGSSSTERELITVTQQPVLITIDIPAEMQGRCKYRIVREHDGVIDILPAAVIDDGTRLCFEADRFSTYAIVAEPIPDSGSSKNDKVKPIRYRVKADSDTMVVDGARIKENSSKEININTLLPYFEEENEEIIVALSAVVDGQMKWIAQDGRVYWFKDNYRDFMDIKNHWARNDILFTSARELFSGTAPEVFSPDMSMTREMFVTVLGRMWSVDTGSFTASSFSDVAVDEWYAPYVEWAAKAGIVQGYDEKCFGPDDEITREQMAFMIAAFARYANLELNEENEPVAFADDESINTWARDAVKDMQAAGIISGKPGYCFDPQGTATRAEVAAVLKRFIENAVR